MSLQDHQPGREISRLMNGPVTTPNRFVVGTGTDGQAKVCDAAKVAVLGVIEQQTRNDQDLAPIIIDGVVLVEAGLQISEGDRIINDASGKAAPDNGSTGELVPIAGIAKGNGTAGDLIAVHLAASTAKH